MGLSNAARIKNLEGIVKDLHGAQTWAREVGAGDSISAGISVAETRLERLKKEAAK